MNQRNKITYLHINQTKSISAVRLSIGVSFHETRTKQNMTKIKMHGASAPVSTSS